MVIPVELVGDIPPLLIVANELVIMEEVTETAVLLETREYEHK